jgi:hypothetical protein
MIFMRIAYSVILLVCVISACGQKRSDVKIDDLSILIGDWSGESICVDKQKFPGCNDEKVVYHIARIPDKPDTVSLAADKIVNGKLEPMGTIDFVYDPKKQTLTGEFQNSRTHVVMEFKVKDDVLEGTMTELPDKTLVRRMTVKRVTKSS